MPHSYTCVGGPHIAVLTVSQTNVGIFGPITCEACARGRAAWPCARDGLSQGILRHSARSQTQQMQRGDFA